MLRFPGHRMGAAAPRCGVTPFTRWTPARCSPARSGETPNRGLGLAPDDRGHASGQHPSYLIHDLDRVYGADFATTLTGLGVESVCTPIQAPRANAIAERVVRSLRQECLDHVVPLSARHVRSVLAEFVSYYNEDRPHQSLGLETPVPSRGQSDCEVLSRPVLNGLHHV